MFKVKKPKFERRTSGSLTLTLIKTITAKDDNKRAISYSVSDAKSSPFRIWISYLEQIITFATSFLLTFLQVFSVTIKTCQ